MNSTTSEPSLLITAGYALPAITKISLWSLLKDNLLTTWKGTGSNTRNGSI
jgi:hypothetical protein